MAAGNCIILHESPLVEWYYELLVPYVHYIPLKQDMSDLVKILDWIRTHDTDVEQIAKNGAVFFDAYLTHKSANVFVRDLFERVADMEEFLVAPIIPEYIKSLGLVNVDHLLELAKYIK